jgi:hypothetical protein
LNELTYYINLSKSVVSGSLRSPKQ